ncbi:MAG: hypothetical protein H7338_00160 [Candidatus Sericytochromatia bacterium]|nr:hypothetical protein [Candidatus Sericytochromatia bacterium]
MERSVMAVPVVIAPQRGERAPEVRAAMAADGRNWLRTVLGGDAENMKQHGQLGQIHSEMQEWPPAARHYERVIDLCARLERWPPSVVVSFDIRVRLAIQRDQFVQADRLLVRHGHVMQHHALFWRHRAWVDVQLGDLAKAEDSVARGWALVSLQAVGMGDVRRDLAGIATDVCRLKGEDAAYGVWLACLVQAGGVDPSLVMAWCMWLVTRRRAGDALAFLRTASASGLTSADLTELARLLDIGMPLPEAWSEIAAVPVFVEPRVPRLSLTVLVVASVADAGLTACLASVNGIADEILVVAPESASTSVPGFAATLFVANGDVLQACATAIATATGDWLLLIDGRERLDQASMVAVEQAMAVNGPGLIACAVRSAVEVPEMPVAAARLPRLCRIRAGVQVVVTPQVGIRLPDDAPATESDDVVFWRDVAEVPDDGHGSADSLAAIFGSSLTGELQAGIALLAVGDLPAARSSFDAVLHDAAGMLPKPWSWQAYAGLATMLARSGETQQALLHAERARLLHPCYPPLSALCSQIAAAVPLVAATVTAVIHATGPAAMPASLASVAGVADDILVLIAAPPGDSAPGPTSPVALRTLAVGADLTPAQIRNLGLSQATGDWVLMLDGDECLTPDAAALIRRVRAGEQPAVAEYLLPVDVGAGAGPEWACRFFRRDGRQ